MNQTKLECYNHINQDVTISNKHQVQFFTDTVDAPIVSSPTSNTSSNSASQRALRSEALRIATFQGWPLDFISPKSMSSAGFFYRGIQDQTQCAFCFITINQWEPHDNPLVEHQRYAPNCPFILKLPVGNIPLSSGTTTTTSSDSPFTSFALPPLSPDQQIRPCPTPLSSIPRSGFDTCSRFLDEIRPNAFPCNASPSSLAIRPTDDEITSTTSSLSSLSIHPHLQARNPTMVSQEARMKSFDGWPPGLAQRPLQLASAGFFYMNTSDHVRCFCCDGALRNWEPNDDPWVEHARWFSRCSFLLSVKGEEYVKQIHDQYKDDDPGLGGHTRESASKDEETKKDQPAAEAEVAEEIIKPTETSNPRNLSEALLCKICYDQEMSMVFLPCGHSLSCPSCATALSHCPLCRKRIDATVRAFFSFS